MGHSISAFVAERPVVTELSRDLLGAKFYQLKHPRFFILPLTDDVFDAIVAARGSSEQLSEHLWGLTKSLADIARKCSSTGPICYIETDYFGGTGTQSAVTWQAGAQTNLRANEENSINNGLAAIGLETQKPLDEFETLGLADGGDGSADGPRHI